MGSESFAKKSSPFVYAVSIVYTVISSLGLIFTSFKIIILCWVELFYLLVPVVFTFNDSA